MAIPVLRAWLAPLAAGFGAGILSAWGVGGGTLLLLVMTLALGVPEADARCINLLYFLPTAAAGLVFHRKNGLLDRQTAASAAPWGAVAAALGVWLSAALDTAALRRLFGVFLLLAAVQTLRTGAKK